VITDPKDLAKALKAEWDTIEIEGSLRQKVIRIRGTGKFAWLVTCVALGIAVAIFIVTLVPGATAAPLAAAKGIACYGAVTTFGIHATLAAGLIAVGAGSVAALNRFRKYREDSDDGHVLVLKRK
jgi:hypothetical protein